jgi:hypothetical protein
MNPVAPKLAGAPVVLGHGHRPYGQTFDPAGVTAALQQLRRLPFEAQSCRVG